LRKTPLVSSIGCVFSLQLTTILTDLGLACKTSWSTWWPCTVILIVKLFDPYNNLKISHVCCFLCYCCFGYWKTKNFDATAVGLCVLLTCCCCNQLLLNFLSVVAAAGAPSCDCWRLAVTWKATAGDLLSREKLLLCLFISAGTEAGINDCCNWFFYHFSGDSIAMSLQPTWYCNCNFLQLQRCYCHVLGDLLLPRVCYKLLIFFFQITNRCWFVFFTT